MSKAARVIEKDVLEAPCIWCEYNGPGYWQRETHADDCPWRNIGGKAERSERAEPLSERRLWREAIVFQKEIQRLQAEVERLQAKDARWQNEMDAANKKVLRMHQQSKASEACLAEIRALPENQSTWKAHSYQEGYVHGWNALLDELRKILEKHDA